MSPADRHSERATRALRCLGEADPALGALALWCRHRDAAEGDAPAWTDGATIHYGPGFAALPDHEQVGVAAHQILHVAFRHASRAGAMAGRFGDRFDAATFNLAADALINETLLLAGHALPRPCVTLVGLLHEAFGERAAPEEAVSKHDAEALYIRLMRAPASRTGARSARDGDGQGGASAAARAKAYASRQRFAEDLVTGRTDPEAPRPEAAEAAEWRQRVARAFEAGRQAGVGVGAIGWRLADLPEQHTPWEVVLRGAVARAVAQGPRLSHARPARRWIAREDDARRLGQAEPAFEPALLRERAVPRLVVAVDCSGSIDGLLLERFAAEVAGVGRRTGAEVHVLVFDTDVRARTVMRGADWEHVVTGVAFARDGGTSFVAVMDAAGALDPAVIVVLTDLDGPFGPAPGRVPVIWAVPSDPVGAPPPFGRVLSLAR